MRQSKPAGRVTGSITCPIVAAMLESMTGSSAERLLPGIGIESRAHSTADTITIVVPTSRKNRFADAYALRAITLGPAWTLKLDGELGSIETGKRADFAVLEDDPTAIAPEKLKDVRVWGTVQGGRVFEAAKI